MVTQEDVLDFWFGPLSGPEDFPEEKAQLWFSKKATTDRTIRERFTATREEAAAGRLADWLDSPRGRLACILLIDQFSRNIFRETPEVYVHDALCRDWVAAGLSHGHDRELYPIERLFFYMPLLHSEHMNDQDKAVSLLKELRVSAPASLQEQLTRAVDSAERHREIVARFGRFPHRNRLLGRVSTPEERHFLTQPGSSF